MRLIKVDDSGGYTLTPDLLHDVPPYAILSHTWGKDGDEVTMEELRQGIGKSKAGYAKIEFCMQQAVKDGLEYCWVDTSCIDKSNSAELSEAINSMFRWYSRAERCYAYLSDVSARKRDRNSSTSCTWEHAFRNSRWFTRGWTLQELLAPTSVQFFSREAVLLGSKTDLAPLINSITGIPIPALHGRSPTAFSVNERRRWATKRDTTRVEDKAYCLLGVFGVFMSPVYGEGENAWARLKDEISKLHHQQFEESWRTSVGGKTSVGTFMHPSSVRRALMKSLSFDQMDARRTTIKDAYSTTCKWVLEHPTYIAWKDPGKIKQHNGFMWIKGKPGAGKSTLIKFAHARAAREQAQNNIVLSFFFNARGEELERSTLGMYRSLLYQLLRSAEDLQQVLDSMQPEETAVEGFDLSLVTWTVESLQTLLSAALNLLGHRQVKCFIDALDECGEEEVQDMVHHFEGLSASAVERSTSVYVCFASRHYPSIDIRTGCQMVLEQEKGHDADLAKYVHNNFRARSGQYVDEVRSEILFKANGVFLWAVLVVDMLNKEFLHGRIWAVRKRLQEIPSELSQLFNDMLKRDSTNMKELLLCIQWILFARQPLAREEFYFAMVTGLDPDPQNLAAWDDNRTTIDDMSQYVLACSKGLAELTQSEAPKVQFIHESVRNYLLQHHGLRELWPELPTDITSMSHDQLRQCCYNYLISIPGGTDLFEQSIDDESLAHFSRPSTAHVHTAKRIDTEHFPFARYAREYLFDHAEEAAKGLPQDGFLANFTRQPWVQIKGEHRHRNTDAMLLHSLAVGGYTGLTSSLLSRGSAVESKNHYGATPIISAARAGKSSVVQMLLSHGADVDAMDSDGHTALLYAAEWGYDEVVQSLLSSGSRREATDTLGRTALLLAAAEGHAGVVQLLLSYDAYIEAADHEGHTALHLAVSSSYSLNRSAIVRLLLDHGADIQVEDESGNTIMKHALYKGSEDVLNLLQSHGTGRGRPG